MIDPRRFDDIARRIQATLPPGLDGVREDMIRNIRAIVAAGIARMDLVEREEFDVQSAVLARTREKLETLEARVRALEERLEGSVESPVEGPVEGPVDGPVGGARPGRTSPPPQAG